MSDIKSVMKEYGQFRLSDLYKEHHHQCSKLEVLVESFAGGPSRFATHELLTEIRTKVIERFGMPTLDGIDIEPRELAVAHFLFRVGFINARDEKANDGESLHFIRFEDRPHLLKGKQNMDDGLPWEVHPAYRSVLRMEGGYTEFTDPTAKFKAKRKRKARTEIQKRAAPVPRAAAIKPSKPDEKKVEQTAPSGQLTFRTSPHAKRRRKRKSPGANTES